MGVRSLADGHTKFTICTTKPEDPAAPTITELAAGIDASCVVLSSDFAWGATDSDKVDEKALCTTNNANSLGASNYTAGATFFRYFDADTGAADTSGDDKAYQAVKAKGTTLYGYARRTAKESTEAWAEDDEIYLGAEFITDTPQPPSDQGGFVKWRVPFEIQTAYDDITAAAASAG